VSALSIGLMAMNLPLSRMGLQEKLVAMELLWADLSATPIKLCHRPGTAKSA